MLPLAQAGSNAKLLQKTLAKDLSGDNQNAHPPLDDLLVAPLQLGNLGKAMLVKPRLGAFQYCGATGNCPIWVYILRNGRYEPVLGDPSDVSAPEGTTFVIGWAFAIVPSSTNIPNLVVISNAGGGHQILTRYRFDHPRFRQDACEDITMKDSEKVTDWFDPTQVNVTPCPRQD